MKAITYTQYGPPKVLKLKDIPKPIPKGDQLLIKVHAASVTPGDCEIRALRFPLWVLLFVRIMFGFFKPKRQVLGMDFAGKVLEVGDSVEGYKVGDEVFGSSGMELGAYAEYAAVTAENPISLKPDNLTFGEAAGIPTGGINALHYLRLGNIQKGDKILINGAGGNFGSFGIMLAKYYGAHVTGVDRFEKLEFMKELGADWVIDFTQEDFSASGEKYDLIFDVHSKGQYGCCIKSLKDNGRLVLANPRPNHMLRSLFTKKTSGKKVYFSYAGYHQGDLDELAKLMAEGHIKSPIDKSYKLEDAAEAHTYVDKGLKTGSVILKVME